MFLLTENTAEMSSSPFHLYKFYKTKANQIHGLQYRGKRLMINYAN